MSVTVQINKSNNISTFPLSSLPKKIRVVSLAYIDMRSKKKREIRSKMTLQEGGKDEALVIVQILTSRSA